MFSSKKKPTASSSKIFLTKGKYLGTHTWQYVRIDNLKLPLFQHALHTGTVDASEFGEVLFSGWGKEPPADVRSQIDALYH